MSFKLEFPWAGLHWIPWLLFQDFKENLKRSFHETRWFLRILLFCISEYLSSIYKLDVRHTAIVISWIKRTQLQPNLGNYNFLCRFKLREAITWLVSVDQIYLYVSSGLPSSLSLLLWNQPCSEALAWSSAVWTEHSWAYCLTNWVLFPGHSQRSWWLGQVTAALWLSVCTCQTG